LSLGTNGCFTGSFSAAGTFTPTFKVTDAVAATDTQQITWTANATLNLDTTTLDDGLLGAGFIGCLSSSGGTTPYVYSLNAGSSPLPTGLTLTGAGCFTGTFSAVGTFTPTFKVTDFVVATDTQQITWTVNSGAYVDLRPLIVNILATTAQVTISAIGLPYENDCTVVLHDADDVEIDSKTSTSGFAVRNLTFTGLTAATEYSVVGSCVGATPNETPPYPFITFATPTGGARTVPISFGTPNLSGAERVTVEYDDNEALSSPATSQNTNCGSGCTVNLSLNAGLWYYRHKWQSAADAVLATGAVQPLQVQ
jgi:hypothetical protein